MKISLSELAPTFDSFNNSLSEASIEVGWGRHFILPMGDQKVVATMKEIVAYYQNCKNDPGRADSIQEMRDKIIVLDLLADAKLSSKCCGVQFISWILRILGGTYGENYHINNLMPLEKSNETCRSIKKTILDKTINISDEVFYDYNQAHIQLLAAKVMEKNSDRTAYELKLGGECARANDTLNTRKTDIGDKEGQAIKDYQAAVDRLVIADIPSAEYAVKHAELVEIFLKVAKTSPLTAFYLAQHNVSTVESLVLSARVKELKPMVLNALQKVDALG